MLKSANQLKVGYFSKKNQLSPFGKKLEKIGKQAIYEAIAKHKVSGNPIYYKEKDQLIKEMADGTRYLVKASLSGIETIRKL